MKKKILYGTILLAMFLVLFFIFTPKAFAETGWRNVGGKWYYYYNDYSYVTGRYQVDGEWYYFDKNGVMQTGWIDDSYTSYTSEGKKYVSHNWYYFDPATGAAYKGSKQVKGTWYYFSNYGGRMVENSAIRGEDGKICLYGTSGAWVQGNGWKSVTYDEDSSSKSWYYLKNGYCVTGWQKIGGSYYYFDTYEGRMEDYPTAIPFEGNEEDYRVYCFKSSGEWVSNPGKWYKDVRTYGKATYTTWYYFNNTSYAKTGWQKIDGVWYYFDEWDGSMADRPTAIYDEATDTSTIYCFNSSGVWVKNPNGWYSATNTREDGTKHTSWWYFKNGEAATGLTTIDGKTYYFYSYGVMARGTASVRNTETNTWDYYYFDETSGEMKTNYWHKEIYTYYDSTGKQHESTDLSYYGADGKKTTPTGWQKIDGAWYYFNEYGNLVRDGSREIDGKVYFFGEDGKMKSNGWASRDYYYISDGKEVKETEWFYLDASGAAATGGRKIGGTWYYFEDNGRMVADRMIRVSAKDWNQPEPDWNDELTWEENYALRAVYAFNKDGAMLSNTWYEDKWSWMDSDGKVHSGSEWYYLGSTGAALKGWKSIGGSWYFFNADGIMMANDVIERSASDWTKPAPEWTGEGNYDDYLDSIDYYVFSSSGAMVAKKGWASIVYTYTDWETNEEVTETYWYYVLGSSGKVEKGNWITEGKTKYFVNDYGRMVSNCTMRIEDEVYAFNKDGSMAKNGWFKYVDTYTDWETNEKVTRVYWYYLGTDGKAYRGLNKVNGKYYYFDEYYAEMRTNMSIYDSATSRNYVFGDDGEQLFNSWYEDRYWTYVDGENIEVIRYMYVGSDGDFVKGWLDLGEDRYYFDQWNHEMYTGIHEIDGVTYEFGDDGKLIGEVTTEPESPIGPGAGDMTDPTLGSSVPEMEVIPVEEAEETEEVEAVETTEPEKVTTETEVIEETVEEVETNDDVEETEEAEMEEVVVEETEEVEPAEVESVEE